MTTLVPSITEVYLCDPNGVRVACLDYLTEYAYVLKANDVTPCLVTLPSRFDRKLVKLDSIIEIWRGFQPGTLRLDYCGFLRAWLYATDDTGSEYTILRFVSTNDLLRRRIVARYAGSAESEKTDYADDMMKAIIDEQLCDDTLVTGRVDMTNIGGGLTIQPDLSDGQSITKAFAWRNVLEALQEIADASKQAGTEVYFNIVPIESSAVTGQLGFEFRTYTDQLGKDRTADSDAPVYIGTEWGNMSNPAYEADYTDEVNFCVILGQGEGIDRLTDDVQDDGRIGMSIWNWREGAKDARNTDFGGAAAVLAEGNAYLTENRPRFKFAGSVVETPAFRYGLDWFHGDRVTVAYAGMEWDGMIDNVMVSRDASGQETITAKVEIEE